MREQVSIKQIAEQAGVSVATVSRIINQSGRYSKETEERVQRIIAERNYVTNHAAKSLRVSNSRIIGVVVPEITHEFFGQICGELQRRFMALGYTTIIYSANEIQGGAEADLDAGAAKAVVDQMRSLNVCGVVLLAIKEMLDIVNRLEVPLVCVDMDVENSGSKICSIRIDHGRGTQLAIEELEKRGCKSIAMAALDPELVLGAIINKQYADICAGAVIVSHGIGFAPTKEAIGAAWDSGVRFDGLVTHNDNEAIGAMVALIERGVRIPEDVKVVGSDDLSTARDSIIPVTTIHHDIEQIGRNAVEAMSEMLGGRVPEEYPPVDNWLIRRSTT